MASATFEDVVVVLREERSYQHDTWGHQNGQVSIAAYVAYMESYLAEVKHLQAHNDHALVLHDSLAGIRKVAALGIACLETHGAPHRIVADVGPPADQTERVP